MLHAQDHLSFPQSVLKLSLLHLLRQPSGQMMSTCHTVLAQPRLAGAVLEGQGLLTYTVHAYV